MLNNIKVLYADSDPNVIELVSNQIRQRGWEVDTATCATEVVSKVNESCLEGKKCYDAIITAISFFDSNENAFFTGITAAKLIRKARADVPIVFVSQHNNALLREEVRRVGGNLLLRPLDTDILIERIEQLVNWSRQTQSTEGFVNRRVKSINLTNYCRRATDRELAFPVRLLQIRDEVKNYEGRQCNTQQPARGNAESTTAAKTSQ